MSEVNEVSLRFRKDMKVGDDVIVLGQHVRITEIELVIHVDAIDSSDTGNAVKTVSIPIQDFNNPFQV